jgi:glycosyltransferase involved in cell wall biosynthesis
MSISVVIPCHIKDINCISNILTDLNNQTRKPDEILIFIKPVNDGKLFDYFRKFIDKDIKLDIITNIENTTIGYSKNRCIEKSNFDIICAMDADDRVHPQKLEIIDLIFSKMVECDVVVHNYVINDTSHFSNLFDLEKIDIEKCYTDNIFWGVLTETHPKIHHAHCSVRKKVFEKYSFEESWEKLGMDDSLFLNTICKNEYCIYSVNFPLISFEIET